MNHAVGTSGEAVSAPGTIRLDLHDDGEGPAALRGLDAAGQGAFQVGLDDRRTVAAAVDSIPTRVAGHAAFDRSGDSPSIL